jgi:hypothetical protein
VITVSTSGPPNHAAWYAIYYATTAIDAMCVRKGKAGSVTALGMFVHDHHSGFYDLWSLMLGNAGNLVVGIEVGESTAGGVATA